MGDDEDDKKVTSAKDSKKKDVQQAKNLLDDLESNSTNNWVTIAIKHYKKNINKEQKEQRCYQQSKEALRSDVVSVARSKNYIISDFFGYICRELDKSIRTDLKENLDGPWPDGLIILMNNTMPSLDLGTDSGSVARKEFSPLGVSQGMSNGIAVVSKSCFFVPYAVIAHEIAHTIFMKHWIHGDAPDFTCHDHKDNNCLMCYPYINLPTLQATGDNMLCKDHFAVVKKEINSYKTRNHLDANRSRGGKYQIYSDHFLPYLFHPHFCGKCILNLRGWNVRKDHGLTLKNYDADNNYDVTNATFLNKKLYQYKESGERADSGQQCKDAFCGKKRGT